MRWGNQTHWDSNKETIEEWLERESHAQEAVENPQCPHCHYINFDFILDQPIHEWHFNDRKMTCGSCGQLFLCTMETQIRFETKKISE
jgi:hypothetical protein